MSITDLEPLFVPPMTEAELEKHYLELEKAKRQRSEYDRDPAGYLRQQGIGMVDHLQQYIRGEEQKFSRYFALVDPVHEALHDSFWNEARARFPVMTLILDTDDPKLGQIEFSELGAGLLLRMDSDSEGNPFGLLYEGYITPDQPKEILGKVATGLAMS